MDFLAPTSGTGALTGKMASDLLLSINDILYRNPAGIDSDGLLPYITLYTTTANVLRRELESYLSAIKPVTLDTDFNKLHDYFTDFKNGFPNTGKIKELYAGSSVLNTSTQEQVLASKIDQLDPLLRDIIDVKSYLAGREDGNLQSLAGTLRLGCTNKNALNFDPNAEIDNGSCVFVDTFDTQETGRFEEDMSYSGATAGKCEIMLTEEAAPIPDRTCFSNPSAPIPSWTSMGDGEVFFNQRTCEYSVVVFADPPDCNQEYLDSFIPQGVKRILEHYNKESVISFTSNTGNIVQPIESLAALLYGSNDLYRDKLKFTGSAQRKDFFIPSRLLAKTKVLITVSAEEFNRIPEKNASIIQGTPITGSSKETYVVFSTKDIVDIFNIVAKTFRYYEVFYADWHMQTGKVIKGLNLTSDASRIEKFYKDLSLLLSDSGYSLKQLKEIEIGFTTDYQISYIKAHEKFRPPELVEKGFESFKTSTICSNRTIMSYISKLPDIKQDIQARKEISWYDLLKKYRFPYPEEVYVDDLTSPISDANAGIKKLAEAACSAGLPSQPKRTAGEWASMQVSSIKDALMSELNSNPCAIVDSKILELENRESVAVKLIDLTLKEYLSSDRIINDLPELIANGRWDDINSLYSGMLNNLGYCGFIDLTKSAIDCLLNSLGYDDSINIILASAIRGMDKENFAKFLSSIPEEAQQVIVSTVSETTPQLLPFLQSLISVRIVGDNDLEIKAVYDKTLAYSYTGAGEYPRLANPEGNTSSPTFFGQAANRDYPPPSAEDWKTLQETVYDLTINRLLNLDDLMNVLETLPGASIIVSIIQKLDKFCAVPPRFYPPLNELVKLPGVNFDICNLVDGFTFTIRPSFQVPTMTVSGISKTVIDNAMVLLEQLLIRLLVLVIKKILEIIFEELCKQRGGSDPLALRNAMLSRCGSELDPSVVDEALVDISSVLGCITDGKTIGKFIDNISSVVTECELVDLINGNASDNIYNLVLQIIKVDPDTQSLSECLNDKETITSFFKAIGLFIDLEALCISRPSDLPISQEVCNNLGLLQVFRETRAQALREKGVDEECVNEQLCRLRDRTSQDLSDLSDLLQNGFLENIVPNFFKDPKNPDTSSILPAVLPTTEIVLNSMYDSMIEGLAAQYTEDIIGQRGFFNMCLADSRGRGYSQHLNLEGSIIGPSVFNIYGSRGTRTQPPWEEWGSAKIKSPYNKWVDQNIEFSEGSFWTLPFMFNPLQTLASDAVPEIGVIEGDGAPPVTKGQPPAVGGLPDKVAGYLQDTLSNFSLTFNGNNDFSVTQTWVDYDEPEDFQFIFSYDNHVPPPDERFSYEYSGYRLRIVSNMKREFKLLSEELVDFTSNDTVEPIVSSYIKDFIYEDQNQTPSQVWSKFISNSFAKVLLGTDKNLAFNVLSEEFSGRVYDYVSSGFINKLARDISKMDIFDYGFNFDVPPEVIYFHEDKDLGMTLEESVSRYGGSEANPPFYIKEPDERGFLRVANSIIPDLNVCKTAGQSTTFPNFNEVKSYANNLIGKIKDDERLSHAKGDIKRIQEAPFERALPAAAISMNEALLFATIRVYISEVMLKSLPVFYYLKPKHENYSNMLSEYIISFMEKGLKESGRSIRYLENYEDYWWLFLEQVVQSFTTKIEYGIIKDQTQEEKLALDAIFSFVEENWTGDNGYVFFRNDPLRTGNKKKENWNRIVSNPLVIENSKVILRRYISEELDKMTSIFNEVLPLGRKLSYDESSKSPRTQIESISEILLNSPYSDPSILANDFPFVAGAVNEIENGPVDVPGKDYFFQSRYTNTYPHPLDSLNPPFEQRAWPFVLERYVTSRTAATSLGRVANIFDWEQQGVLGEELYFGMRLSFVPDEQTKSNVDFQSLVEALSPNADYAEKAYSDIYKNLIPLVSVEIKINEMDYSASLYNRVNAAGTSYAQQLLCRLIETTEYKLIFNHIFPLSRYTSFLAIYTANTFVPSLARVDDGWAATPFDKKGGGQWIGFGKMGGMRTWRGNEGMKNTFGKAKTMIRQMLESSCNTNYLYKDRDEMSLSEAYVENVKTKNQSDIGIKWWQWPSLRPAPCKKDK